MNDARLSGRVAALSGVVRGLGTGPIVILSLLAVAAIMAATFPAGTDLVGPIGTLIGFSAASLTIFRKGPAAGGRDRIAWRLIGTGFAAATVGMLVVIALEATGHPVPAFGPIDLFFISAYALILVGFSFLPQLASNRMQRVRVYLDSAIGALSIGAVMWVLVLDDLVHAFAGASAWERFAGTAYPVLDVAAIVVVVIVVSRRSAFRFDPRLMLFGLGVLIQAYADIEYLRAGVGRSFGEVEPNFTAFVAAATLYYVAALIVDRSPPVRSYADRPASVWSMIGPYAAALALVVLVFTQIQLSSIGGIDRLALVMTLIVGTLVVTRQSVAIHENRRMLDRQRSDLVRSIAHELRTPLTAVVGFLEELTDHEDAFTGDERRDLLQVVAGEARYLELLVADLAPLQSGGGGNLTLEVDEVSIADAVRRGAAITRGMAETSVEDGLVAIADPNRVQQALVNLISNAKRYGGGRIEIVAYRRRADAVIEVHDDGPGVPKKWERVIWDRFERGANRYDATRPGSGIGLAMVAAIVEAHGGSRAYRRSERLGGACFSIELVGRVVAPVPMAESRALAG